jgi:hypothetical protein
MPLSYGAVMLDREQLQAFAERGFVVVPQVVPQELLAQASRTIDELLSRDPPAREVRGPHFYFLQASTAPALLALLMQSPAFALAESLTGTGTLEVPWQVQVALNVPPFAHRPGGHHLDGASPPEPDGRPGTFTLLAGVLLARYLLGHNIGGNTSDTVRRAVYFRVKRAGHAARWRRFLQDAWLDFDAVRDALP